MICPRCGFEMVFIEFGNRNFYFCKNCKKIVEVKNGLDGLDKRIRKD